MRLFGKKRGDDEPVDPNERSPQLGLKYKDAVTSPDFVREADDFFQDLADRHGAEYDGWEVSA